MKKQWAEMTPEEKREERFNRWLNPPNVKFKNAAAEKAYKTRVNRFITVIKLGEPDRVYKSRGYEQLVYFGRKPGRFWFIGGYLVQTTE